MLAFPISAGSPFSHRSYETAMSRPAPKRRRDIFLDAVFVWIALVLGYLALIILRVGWRCRGAWRTLWLGDRDVD